ncbi:hypothetical protein PINS_up010261 [Pythium insidiosum]|nr:hypothetical protein PINS_up010261 [Pythium insidiosum]
MTHSAVLVHRGVCAALSHASISVVVVIRNALISVACAWFIMWWGSLGGAFLRGRSVSQQSYDELYLWTLLWLQFFFCAAGTVMQATLLLRTHFVDRPGRPTTLRICCWRILRHSFPVYALVVIAVYGTTVGLSRVINQRSVRALKIEFYVGGSLTFAYWVCLELVGRYVFKRETVEGRARVAQQQQQQQQVMVGTDSTTVIVPVVAAVAVSPAASLSRWKGWRSVLWKRTPVAFSVIAAAIYIQVLSSQRIHNETELVALMAGNMLLKFVIQHVTKRAALRTGVQNIRTMLLTVSFPTVLIDTQLRVLLQRVSSTTLTIKGTVLMAAIEIALRLHKALAMRRRLRAIANRTEGRAKTDSTSDVVVGLRDKLLAYRSAELFADMAAEYIAIGCAVGILLCYWEHPKYRLGEVEGRVTSHWNRQQTVTLLAQGAMEIAVDVLSSTFEVTQGITFHAVRRQGAYVVLLFVATAVANTTVTSVVYMRVE